MRLIVGTLFTIFVCGCTDTKPEHAVEGTPKDTVYDGDIIWREKLESKRATIQLDNGAGGIPRFVIGDTSVLRIRIPRFTEYDIHLNQIAGATVIKLDTAVNTFLVIPVDNQFSFVLNQYYPKGQVIRYTRNWNKEKAIYDEKVVPLDSLVQIGKLDFNAD
jgi:hypothetical protein